MTTADKTMKTGTSTPQGGALVPFDYGSDAGAGFSGMTASDFKIPFLEVLQKGSPECEDGNPDQLDGARAGMLHDTVSDRLYQSVTIVPVGRQHVWTEWVPRSEGGGFRGKHQPSSAVVRNAPRKRIEGKETMIRVSPDGNDLVETFYLYAVVLDDAGAPIGAAVIALTSTKIGPYQEFNTRLKEFTGTPPRMPLYAFRVRLSTEFETRSKGNSFNVRLEPAGGKFSESLISPSDPAYLAAKSLAAMVDEGRATIDPTQGAESAIDPDPAF